MAKRTEHKTPVNLEIGKIPPQSIEMEEAVLGALMLEKSAIEKVIDYLRPECFYKEENNKIYSAILKLYSNGTGIDSLTVSDQLRKGNHLDEVGGVVYITQLTTRVASSVHLEYHAKKVYETFVLREIIRVSSDLQNQAFDPEAEVNYILDYAEEQIFKISQINGSETYFIYPIIENRIQLYEKIESRGTKFNGVITGHQKIDKITLGWQKQDLIIIAARPSVGKTMVMLHFIYNAMMIGTKILVFTLEMSKEQLADRLLSIASQVNPIRARMGSMSDEDWVQMGSAVNKFIEKSVIINDNPAITINEMRSKCRKAKKEYGIEIVYIDYLQLMSGERNKNDSREHEVSQISRKLKWTAKELDIPVVALSQLNRDAEMKRPNLAHLRESGALEQDADIVVFIHRERDSDGELAFQGDFIVAKHRNGAIGDFPFWVNNAAMTGLYDNSDGYTNVKTFQIENRTEPQKEKDNGDVLPF